jgi:hypothetical protein
MNAPNTRTWNIARNALTAAINVPKPAGRWRMSMSNIFNKVTRHGYDQTTQCGPEKYQESDPGGQAQTNAQASAQEDPQRAWKTSGQGKEAKAGPMKKDAGCIYTVGHSTHPIDEFLAMLKSFQIRKLIDVRTIPKSRHNPQFNQESLAVSLGKENIEYRLMPGLGGLRRPLKDSINRGWRNASFRGYADYMQTPAFETNLQALIKEAKKPAAIMCAEAVPWRCHRSLIADALMARGWDVRDIMKADHAAVHKINPMARIGKDKKVYYPDENLTLF